MVKILDEYVDGFRIMHLRMEHGVNRLLDDALHGFAVEFLDARVYTVVANRDHSSRKVRFLYLCQRHIFETRLSRPTIEDFIIVSIVTIYYTMK